ncbi:MAG: ecotin family protein [Chromatiales bacterium]|nr:ecotin family protein [Chromatiales bacterium]
MKSPICLQHPGWIAEQASRPGVASLFSPDWLGGVPAAGLAADDLEPFPKAASGYRRVVIRLPAVDTPDDRRVEMIFGKAMEVGLQPLRPLRTADAHSGAGLGL